MWQHTGQTGPATVAVRLATLAVRVTVVLAAVLAGAGACGRGGELPPPPDPPAEPAPAPPVASLEPRDAEAWQEIQTRFDAFMEAWIRWSAEGIPGGFDDPAIAELHEHADVLLWDEVVSQLRREATGGRLRTGRPQWRDATLIGIDWQREIQGQPVPEATFDVCVDESGWALVEADTGEPVPSEPAGPRRWRVIAAWVEDQEFGPDGWGLTERHVRASQAC